MEAGTFKWEEKEGPTLVTKCCASFNHSESEGGTVCCTCFNIVRNNLRPATIIEKMGTILEEKDRLWMRIMSILNKK